MSRLRFSIGALILVVAIAAVALAAIRSGSLAWAGAMISITFFAMICSLVGIAFGRGMRRVYWWGFALLGWSYLFLMFAPWLSENIGERLLAPNLTDYLDEFLYGDATPSNGGSGGLQSVPIEILGANATAGGFGGGPTNAVASVALLRIGIALGALLWAFLGGWAACYFASGREEEHPSQPATATANAPG
jgi:hypothetical protein